MNEKNYSDVGQAMNFVLRPMLAAYIQKKLAIHFGAREWWQRGVLDKLFDEQKRFLPRAGTYDELLSALDIKICLRLMEIHWREIFSEGLPREYFNWIKELASIRNRWAHEPDSFDDDSTLRALDTMRRVSESFDEEISAQLRAMWSARLQPQKNFGLKPWREVMEPREDVACGRYRQAEFAADLGQVVRGEGSSEYTDAVEFFSRTYLTGGLKTLLVETLKRLTTGAGNPVIQLKTSFGGGKTHSLLALYHLFGGKIRAEQSSAVREVLGAAGVEFLPKVHTAVIVGTWENPLDKTLWGEIAAQLSRSTGKPELYEMMRRNDEQRISPGVDLLRKIFDEAGACLILIDELVAYGRKLRSGKEKSGGTFDNFLTFIQELTEAAKASPRTTLVVSIPESDIEIGGAQGRRVLNQIEKVVGRMEFIWSPITSDEGYEIVRRRLFKPCSDEQAREKVCAAFFSMYVANENEFPYESRQSNHREKLLACYPIHPKLFDYLYEKWTSLDGFQKTRGVLRLMANVIYHLWTSNDASLLIMPGNLPMNFSPVRDELAKLLKGNWDAIIGAEVDGEHSKPYELDSQNPRFGRLSATRKIARTIFMGSAPGSREGDIRGVDETEIRFGVIQPQEVESISDYNDALTKLKANLYYLYSRDGRFWFGTNPTLRKIVNDKRVKISLDDIEYEIEKWLGKWKSRGQFRAVYACPKSSADVPDEQTARLIILPPKFAFVEGLEDNAAVKRAKDFLDNRGTVPRRWKNMLLFMAADEKRLEVLHEAARDFLAWTAVNKESRTLNLDSLQLEDAKSNLKTATETFAMKISQAYGKIFAPERSDDGDLNRPPEVRTIECTKEENISVASEKFIGDEILLGALGCRELLRLLDKFLWREKDSLTLGQLWEYFATYYYLPRLLDENVLFGAVRKGVAEKVFAVAEDFSDGKYSELRFGEVSNIFLSDEKFLVKAEVAREQLNLDDHIEIETPPKIVKPVTPPVDLPPKKSLPKKFSMDAELNRDNCTRYVKRYVDEIASQLMDLPDAKISIHVAIKISAPEGIPAGKEELVTDICRELKVENFQFES